VHKKAISLGILFWLITSGIIIIISVGNENAQGTDISGDVYDGAGGPWTISGSPYIVTGDITVPLSEILTIEPGVNVKFDGGYNIFVKGNLTMVGTSIEKIWLKTNKASPTNNDWGGVTIESTGHAEIEYCDFRNGNKAINLDSSSNNNITNCNFYNNYYAIYFWFTSTNNNVSDNSFKNNYNSISVYGGWDNKISGNSFEHTLNDQEYCFYISSSLNISVTNNYFVNGGIFLSQDQLEHIISYDINNNLVNSKPLYFLKNTNSMDINGESIGQLIIINCSNINISNIQIDHIEFGVKIAYSECINLSDSTFSSNKRVGIDVYESSYINISNNELSNNNYGIQIDNSEDCYLTNNNVSDSRSYGIYFDYSRNIHMSGNILGKKGLYIYGSPSHLPYYDSHDIQSNNLVNGKPLLYYANTHVLDIDGVPCGQLIMVNCGSMIIKNLDISGIHIGMHIINSDHLLIMDNSITSMYNMGIYLLRSSSIQITKNSISECFSGLKMEGCSYINISTNNFYNTERSSITCYSSDNNTVTYNTIDSDYPPYLYSTLSFSGSDYNKIYGNTISNQETAISFGGCDRNEIRNNTIQNNANGIRLNQDSQHNKIYHNSFINNIAHAYDYNETNYWNASYPIGGNYWSDYEGPDIFRGAGQNWSGSDNLGDIPYLFDTDTYDLYPLIEPVPDNMAPRITLETPEDNSVILPGTILSFNIREGNLDVANFSLDYGPDQPFVHPFNISTSGWSDGYHTISIDARDTNNNHAVEMYHFTIDSQKPVIILNSPDNNSMVRGGEIDLSAEDPNLASCDYSINGGPTQSLANPFDISTSILQEGNHSILITATDVVGNTNSLLFFITIDRTGPAISNVSYSHEHQRHGGYINISASITDIHGIGRAWVRVDDPNGNRENFNMTYDPENNKYFMNKSYNILGEYRFSLWAADKLDLWIPTGFYYWRSSGSYFFLITTTADVPTDFICSSGDSYVSLTWSDPKSDGGSPVTNYRIYRGINKGEETLLGEVGNISSYNDTTVVNGITYYYKISAVNFAGEGLNVSGKATPIATQDPLSQPAKVEKGIKTETWIMTIIVIIVIISVLAVLYTNYKRKLSKAQPKSDPPKTKEKTETKAPAPSKAPSEKQKEPPPPPPPK
jgi:parallel beta-helix repeat protein